MQDYISTNSEIPKHFIEKFLKVSRNNTFDWEKINIELSVVSTYLGIQETKLEVMLEQYVKCIDYNIVEVKEGKEKIFINYECFKDLCHNMQTKEATYAYAFLIDFEECIKLYDGDKVIEEKDEPHLQHEPPSMHLPPISPAGNLQHEPPSMHLPPISLTGNLQHEPPSMHLPPISLTGNLQHEIEEKNRKKYIKGLYIKEITDNPGCYKMEKIEDDVKDDCYCYIQTEYPDELERYTHKILDSYGYRMFKGNNIFKCPLNNLTYISSQCNKFIEKIKKQIMMEIIEEEIKDEMKLKQIQHSITLGELKGNTFAEIMKYIIKDNRLRKYIMDSTNDSFMLAIKDKNTLKKAKRIIQAKIIKDGSFY